MRQPTLALLGVLATVSLAARVTAQAAPSIEQWEQTLANLRHEVRYKALKAPTDEDRKALGEPERKLREFATALEQRAGLTVEHYVKACEAFSMWYPDVSLRIAEAAKRKWLTKADLLILEVRALALSGEAAAAVDAIARLRAMESSSRTVLEAADALAHLGRKEDALKTLAEQAVVTESAKEPAWERELYGKAVAVMRALWTTDDFSPTGPLRAALTKALDYHVLVTDQGTQIDLASSPIAICRLLGRSPPEAEGVTYWADHVLLVLSVYAAASHHPTAAEQRVLAEWAGNGVAVPGIADVPGCLLSMRGLVAFSDGPATLTALRTVEKFEAMAKTLQPAKPAAPRPR